MEEELSQNTDSQFYCGKCDTDMAPSKTTIVCDHLSGYMNEFNKGYCLQIIKTAKSAPGQLVNPPEGEVRWIRDYDRASGTFMTDEFSTNVHPSDTIIVIHISIITTIWTNDTTNINDVVAELRNTYKWIKR